MKQRLRPITYAESLEAKKFAEEQNVPIVDIKKQIQPEEKKPSSVNMLDLESLPSGGNAYPKNSEVYFSPLTFGEMKYLSVSRLSDSSIIDFFLTKVFTSFPKSNLTYFDFYYIITLVKLATFGELEFTMNFECVACGAVNKAPFSLNDLVFDDITTELPIVVDLDVPYKSSETDLILSKIEFSPITIGRYQSMLKSGKENDLDLYMANCITQGTEEERIQIIKEVFNGVGINLLETIDVVLYHGVQNLNFSCRKIHTDANGVEEVCGRLHDIPFLDIIRFISTTDSTKDSLRKRIHFGLQDEYES